MEQLGGIGRWLGTWAIQFFSETLTGAFVFAFPVILLFVSMIGFMRNTDKPMSVWIPWATGVSACQLLSLYDYNFYWSGALALALTMAVLWCISLFKSSVHS